MPAMTFNETLASIEMLSRDQQETLIEIIHRRLIEARRSEISENARETMKAYKEGKAKHGSVRDLQRALTK